MSITITVPMSRLTETTVATRLTELLSALARAQGAPTSIYTPRKAPSVQAAAPKEQRKMTLKSFAAQLPDRSRLFLEMVEREGEVAVGAVVEALGLSSAKAVGGITGAIGRWGPARGVPLPYEVIRIDGARGWRWLPGHTLVGPPSKVAKPEVPVTVQEAPKPSVVAPVERLAAPKVRPAAPAVRSSGPVVPAKPVAAKPVPAKPVPAKPAVAAASATTTEPAAEAPAASEQTDPLEEVMASLPENSRRFLEMLRARKRMTMPEVLRELGLARAQAVTPLLSPIKEAAALHNMPTPYNHSSTGTGERVFLWPGTPDVVDPGAPRAKSSHNRGMVRRRRRIS